MDWLRPSRPLALPNSYTRVCVSPLGAAATATILFQKAITIVRKFRTDNRVSWRVEDGASRAPWAHNTKASLTSSVNVAFRGLGTQRGTH